MAFNLKPLLRLSLSFGPGIYGGIVPPPTGNDRVNDMSDNFQDNLGQNIVFNLIPPVITTLWVNDVGDNFITDSGDRLIFEA